MSRPRAADDFTTIRARLDELRRERESMAPPDDAGGQKSESEAERDRRARIEGWPPPWVPTIFIKQPPI